MFAGEGGWGRGTEWWERSGSCIVRVAVRTVRTALGDGKEQCGKQGERGASLVAVCVASRESKVLFSHFLACLEIKSRRIRLIHHAYVFTPSPRD